MDRPCSAASRVLPISPTLTLPTAAVPRTAPQRLAVRDADLLSRFRRQPWKARATARARAAGSVPTTRSACWSAHRSAGDGLTMIRSYDAFASASAVSVT